MTTGRVRLLNEGGNMRLIFLLALLAFSSAHAAEVKCVPVGSSRWTSASVNLLQHRAQALYHVKGYGPFIVADLICSLSSCVGFVNGTEVKGSLDRSSGQIRSVLIQTNPGDVVPPGEFDCP